MGNIITFDNKKDLKPNYIKMSNGLTSVFLHTLVLSGSRLAVTAGQKLLMVYLGTQNQSYRGIGTVGFDISEMPWNVHTLEQDKHFMLCAIAKAKEHLGWDLLDYQCKEEFLYPCLDTFKRLIEHLEEHDVEPAAFKSWMEDPEINDPVSEGFPLCEKHHVYLSIFGCLICTD